MGTLSSVSLFCCLGKVCGHGVARPVWTSVSLSALREGCGLTVSTVNRLYDHLILRNSCENCVNAQLLHFLGSPQQPCRRGRDWGMVPATPGETVPWAQAGSSGNHFLKIHPPSLSPWELSPHPWHLPPAWHVTHQEGLSEPCPSLGPKPGDNLCPS